MIAVAFALALGARPAAAAEDPAARAPEEELREEAPAPPAPPPPAAPSATSSALYGLPIESVAYTGLRNVGTEIVASASHLVEGETYTLDNENRTTAALWSLYYFNNVVIRASPAPKGGAALEIELTEQPLIEEIEMRGVSSVPAEVLLKELPFKKGEVLPINAGTEGPRALKAAYSRRGYHGVVVTLETQSLARDAVRVIVRVNEGKRVLVEDIVIEGNRSYTAFRLGFHMETSESWLFVSNYFDETLFKLDLESIADFYASQGFFKVSVREGASRLSEDGSSIVLVIAVEEGPQYKLATVSFPGLTLFTPEELLAQFDGQLGAPFDRDAFRKGVDAIRAMYGNSGWTQVVIDDQVKVTGEDTIEVVLSLNEGQQITVGNIIYEAKQFEIPPDQLGAIGAFWVTIAPPVEKEVVLRRFKLAQGEAMKQDRIDLSLKRLKDLRVFRDVAITTTATDIPTVRDVVIKTTPADTALLFLGASTGDRGGVTGRVVLTERNLFGKADAAEIGVSVGSREFSAHVSYLDRDFLDSDWSARYSAYRNAYRRRGYDDTTLGLSTRFSTYVTDYIVDSYRVRLEDVEIDDVDDDVLADIDDYQVAALQVRRSFNQLDDNDWPTRGYLVAGDIEGGYAGTGFVRLGFDFDYYRPLPADMVWASSLKGDVLPWPDDRDDLGINERLFLGGRSTLRGFRSRGIAPKDEGDDDVALGGLTRMVLRNELRTPLGADILKGVVFVDVGFLDEDRFAYETPRASAGVGLRILTERVNIGIDLGWAIKRESGDDTQVVSFTVDSGI